MRRQEEAVRIMEALSGVDEELLARCEAADAQKRKGNVYRWRYLSRCAAVLALAVVGVVSWRGVQMLRGTTSDGSASGAGSKAAAPDLRLNVDLKEKETDNGSLTDPADGAVYGYEVSGNLLPESTETETDTGGTNELQQILPDVTGGGDKDSLDRTDTEDLRADGGDVSKYQDKTEATGCPALTAQVLTEEEARQIECLGEYMPTALPAGYGFETARYDAETGRLTVCWRRGMDDIMLSFEPTDGIEAETVDIQKPESYDERLYEIPFGDTVPEEYWQAFNAPVFAKDDFSLEMVCSRVISYSGDSGDTSAPRGHFSVLYDGVLVGFNGRGTPEEIWEMFASISE